MGLKTKTFALISSALLGIGALGSVALADTTSAVLEGSPDPPCVAAVTSADFGTYQYNPSTQTYDVVTPGALDFTLSSGNGPGVTCDLSVAGTSLRLNSLTDRQHSIAGGSISLGAPTGFTDGTVSGVTNFYPGGALVTGTHLGSSAAESAVTISKYAFGQGGIAQAYVGTYYGTVTLTSTTNTP